MVHTYCTVFSFDLALVAILYSIAIYNYFNLSNYNLLDDFKYLGSNINSKNNIHNGIKLRISAANRAYFTMNKKILSSRLLSKTTKEKLYACFVRPETIYTCETWSTRHGDKEKLLTFGKKMLLRYTNLY